MIPIPKQHLIFLTFKTYNIYLPIISKQYIAKEDTKINKKIKRIEQLK